MTAEATSDEASAPPRLTRRRVLGMSVVAAVLPPIAVVTHTGRVPASLFAAPAQRPILVTTAHLAHAHPELHEHADLLIAGDTAVDLTAAMLCTREVLRQSMLERRAGVILNFSSTAAYSGMVRKTHYTAAKAALRALTKTIAGAGTGAALMTKLGARNRVEIAMWAYESGRIRP